MLGVFTTIPPRIHLWPLCSTVLLISGSPNISLAVRDSVSTIREDAPVVQGEWWRRERDAKWRWNTERDVWKSAEENVGDNLSTYPSLSGDFNRGRRTTLPPARSPFPFLASFHIWAPIALNLFVVSLERMYSKCKWEGNGCAIMHKSMFAHLSSVFFECNFKNHTFRMSTR